jgi:gamma-glutamyl-gamma-aminobutyrate hydrolase PuuD
MKILVVPKIVEPFKNQFEISIETKLIYFLLNCFKNSLIDITYKFDMKNNYDLIILSGGNTILKYSKKKRDIFREKLDNFFLKKANINQTPVIGICHGGQFLAKKYGLTLTKDIRHVGRHKIKNLSKIVTKFKSVNSFHNIKIEYKKLKNIENLIHADDGSIECFKVKDKKIGAIIWHPEREISNSKPQVIFFKNLYSYIK